jgi:hypothetical protein
MSLFEVRAVAGGNTFGRHMNGVRFKATCYLPACPMAHHIEIEGSAQSIGIHFLWPPHYDWSGSLVSLLQAESGSMFEDSTCFSDPKTGTFDRDSSNLGQLAGLGIGEFLNVRNPSFLQPSSQRATDTLNIG